jgi:hypothetical protein
VSSITISVYMDDSRRLVESLQKKKGFKSFSEALRFIVEDYFRLINKLDEARSADFEKVCELLSGNGGNGFNSAVVEDLDLIKNEIVELKNMLLVVGNSDERMRMEFAKYFPKYFKKQ